MLKIESFKSWIVVKMKSGFGSAYFRFEDGSTAR